MTAENQTKSLEQLADTVGQLAQALAASECRRVALSKRIRWGAAVVLVMLGLGVFITFSDLKSAHAANSGGAPGAGSCNTVECQMQPISMFFGMMLQLMEGMMRSDDVHRYMYRVHEDFRTKVDELKQAQKVYVELTGAEPLDPASCSHPSVDDKCPADSKQCRGAVKTVCDNAQWMGQALQQRFPALAGQTVVDMALLVRRLREDSDQFRDYLAARNMQDPKGGPVAAVAQELHLMNRALAAVPAMAREMNAMNHQMSVMSYSVGSTMGRMGSVMPW